MKLVGTKSELHGLPVYISYSCNESTLSMVKMIIRTIEQCGATVAPSNNDMMPDKENSIRFPYLADHADVLVSVHTLADLESRWMNAEINTAKASQLPIFPVLLEPIELPDILKNYAKLIYTDDDQPIIDGLIQRLSEYWKPRKIDKPSVTLRLPDIQWIKIPAGPFIYGERKEEKN
ncbi:MAG: hypothetical protein RPU32_13790 [Candidatus Sedimenticola sp. (ex Thyasira tokunagai)]